MGTENFADNQFWKQLGQKLSRTTNFQRFRGYNFSRKKSKTVKSRKFLSAKVSSFKLRKYMWMWGYIWSVNILFILGLIRGTREYEFLYPRFLVVNRSFLIRYISVLVHVYLNCRAKFTIIITNIRISSFFE